MSAESIPGVDNVTTLVQPWTPSGWKEGDPTPRLNAALAKAQGMMEAADKDSVNEGFKRKDENGKERASSYASMAAIIAAIRTPFSICELAYTQTTLSDDKGVTVFTHLRHSSGEMLVSPFWVPVAKKDPQGYAAATTYARKTGLLALAGQAPDDDDGNSTSSDPAVVGAKTGIGDKDRNALISAFADIGIGQQELASMLGHPPTVISEAERATLKTAYADARAKKSNPPPKSLPPPPLKADEPKSREPTDAELAAERAARAKADQPKPINFENCVQRIREAKTEEECVLIEAEFVGLKPTPTSGEIKAMNRAAKDRRLILADAVAQARKPKLRVEDDPPF